MIVIFGCLRRVVSLIVLAVLVFLVWYFRSTIMASWQRFRGVQPVAESPVDAERSAQAKYAALASPRPPARVALSEDELQALVRTRFSGMLPRWVDSARIRLEGDKVRLSGRVPVDHLPDVKSLGEVAGLLPDTTEVAVKGQVIPLGQGRVALAVDQVTAAHVPLPHRLIPQVLSGLKAGKPAQASAPADALVLPLPRTISSAYVRGDSLVLLTSAAAGATGAAGAPSAPYSPRRR